MKSRPSFFLRDGFLSFRRSVAGEEKQCSDSYDHPKQQGANGRLCKVNGVINIPGPRKQ